MYACSSALLLIVHLLKKVVTLSLCTCYQVLPPATSLFTSRAGPPVRESGAERQRAGRVAASERCTGSQPALPRHGITLRSRRLLPITAPRWPTRRSGTWTRCRPSIRRWRRAWGSWQTSTGASCGTRHARAACCSSAARGRSRTAPARPTARSTLLGGRGPRPASRCALSGAGAQLTAALEDCLALPELRQEGVLLPIYHSFVASFAHKLNPLRLAQLAVTVAQQGFAEPPRPLEAGARTLCPRSLRPLREACARARGQASARAAAVRACVPLGGCTRCVKACVRAGSCVFGGRHGRAGGDEAAAPGAADAVPAHARGAVPADGRRRGRLQGRGRRRQGQLGRPAGCAPPPRSAPVPHSALVAPRTPRDMPVLLQDYGRAARGCGSGCAEPRQGRQAEQTLAVVTAAARRRRSAAGGGATARATVLS